MQGVRSTLKAGGCNSSRAGFIGMCLAAKEGPSSIPESWKEKTLRFKEVSELCEKLMVLQDTI